MPLSSPFGWTGFEPKRRTVCIGKNIYTRDGSWNQQESMYNHPLRNHESTPPGTHPGPDRPRPAPQPGAVAPAPASARLRRHAGDDLARHRGSRLGQARGGRRLPAARRRDDESGNGADGARAGGDGVSAAGGARAAARGAAGRGRPGAAARHRHRSHAASRGGRDHRRRRHDSHHRARRPPGGSPGEASRRLRGEIADTMQRIVLAYSGGLDTSVAIPWLAEKYGAEIVAVTIDLGQGTELAEMRDRALAAGAVRAHVLDVREEFARGYVLPALQADAIYEDRYPMGTALGRPLIARKLVEIAAIEQAGAIAHGCTGKGNDQVRLDITARALNPAIIVIAPARDWGMTRSEQIEYARQR